MFGSGWKGIQFKFKLSEKISMKFFQHIENLPLVSHFRSIISSSWAQQLNSGFANWSCSSIMWCMKDENFAQITSPFPLGVEVALQCK